MPVSLALPLLLLAPIVSQPDEPDPTRPNIVFAFADDWGRHAGAYAELQPGGVNDVVKTPHFDALARDGVLFTNAYVSAPSCTPCRSSLLSGRHFWQTGRASILLGAVWDGSLPSYPLLLEEAGYHIGHTYKTWAPGTPEVHPYGGDRTRYGQAGGRFNGFSQHVMAGTDEADRQSRVDALLAEARGNFARCVDDAAAAGKPFCYWFGPTNVHRKWIAGFGKQVWGIDPDDLAGKLPAFLPDTPTVREDLADYFGEVAAFDAGLGQLLKELDERGLAENTIVVVSGDHGAPGFPNGKCNLYDFGAAVPLAARWPGTIVPGRVVTDFVSLPDLAPTFLEVGGQQPPDDMTARSLLPVLTSPESGRVDESRTAAYIGRERHVDSAQPDFKPYPMRAVRTDGWLYIRNFKPERYPMGSGPGLGEPDETPDLIDLRENTFVAFDDLDASPTKAELVTLRKLHAMQPYYRSTLGQRPAEELYDLSSDPDQVTNLAADPQYDATRKRLADQLMAKLRETNDPRLVDDGAFYETGEMAADVPNRWEKKGKKPRIRQTPAKN